MPVVTGTAVSTASTSPAAVGAGLDGSLPVTGSPAVGYGIAGGALVAIGAATLVGLWLHRRRTRVSFVAE
ncbi:MAG: hypothetical protein ABW046_22640 [Actinoplanes sp.]